MQYQASTNKPVVTSLHNKNRQNKNKKHTHFLTREAVLVLGKLTTDLGLFVQEPFSVYKASTYILRS